MAGISKSQVSRLCAEIDERVRTFLERPIEGDWHYLWLDATYVKVREAGRIVSVAVTIAVSQLIEHIGLPTLHAPSAPQPGWSHHTRRPGSRRTRQRREHHAGSRPAGAPLSRSAAPYPPHVRCKAVRLRRPGESKGRQRMVAVERILVTNHHDRSHERGTPRKQVI
jgi:hypothetical protein